MADPFIAETDVVDFLGRGDASDPGLSICVDAACEIIRGETGQTLTEEQHVFHVFDGTGTDALLLREHPVTAIDYVNVDGTAVTDYDLRYDGVLVRVAGTTDSPPVTYWPMGRQNIEVQYNSGYDDADFPRDLMAVAVSLAARMWVQGPALEERLGESTVKYASPGLDLTAGEKRILRKYKRAL